MVGREELEAALRSQAAADVPGPGASFADSLEQRLLAGSTSNVVPLARRARAISATAIVTATVVFAGAAAAAGVVVTHSFDDEPAPAPTTVASSTTTPEPTTSAAVVIETTVPVTDPPTTAAPVTAAPTTAASTTAPPTTAAPTTAPPTTEVRTAATISLSCVPDAGTVRCTWVGTPAGTVSFAVLRSQPGTGPGRVYSVPAGTTTWLDPIAASGTTIGYVVHAMDGAGNSLGHSTLVTVNCC